MSLHIPRMAMIRKTVSAGKVLGELAPWHTAGRKRKWCSHLGNHSGISLKTEHRLPCDPAMLLLGIYSKEMKTHVCIKICTQIFRAAFFLVVKTRNYSSVCQLMNGSVMCDISVQEVLFGSGGTQHGGTLTYAKGKRIQKHTCPLMPLAWRVQNRQICGGRKWCQWGWGAGRGVADGCRASLGDDEMLSTWLR